jgi:hypothetical protein
MKVFVDECVPYQLIYHLIGHEFVHVTDTPWRSTKNGALLRLVAPLYDVFITADQNLPYQQSLKKFDLAFVILKAPSNKIDNLLPLVPQTLEALDRISVGDLVIISA